MNNTAYNEKHGKQLKTLTSQQMVQGLTIAVVQVKASNKQENLNKIRRLLYFLYQAKEITQKNI